MALQRLQRIGAHVLAGLVACSACFFAGRLVSANAVDREGPYHPAAQPGRERPADPDPASETTSPLPAPMPERLREVIASPRSPQRLLEVELAVPDLSAGELKSLWEDTRGHLHFRFDDDFAIAAAILGALAKIDPEAALAYAAGDGVAWRPHLEREVVGAWSEVDKDGALAWIAGAGSGVRDRALRAVLERLGDRDREAAVDLFRESVEKGVVGKRAWEAGDFFAEWAREDPSRAAAAALDHIRFTGRDHALSETIAAWGGRDPAAALAWLGENTDGLTEAQNVALTRELLGAWSDSDPAAAAAQLLKVDDPKAFDGAARAVLFDWAAISMDDAATWVAGVEDDRRRHHFERLLVDGARIRGDRNEAIAYARARFEENPGLSHPMYMAVSNAVGDDPAGSVDWVKEIAPNDLVLEEFYNTLLHQWRGRDRGEAARHLDLMPDPVRRAEDYEFFSAYWAAEDLDAAREWANELPESPDRDRALIGVAKKWIGQEPEAALEWIEGLDSGDLRDRAASHYIGQTVDDDVGEALRIARDLSDPFRRDDSLQHVYGRWLEQDPAAAEDAIRADTDLSPTSRWRLLGDAAD